MYNNNNNNCGALWFLFVSWTLLVTSRVHSLDEEALYQKSAYHLEELQKTLLELRSSHNIFKRSVSSSNHRVMEKLASLCTAYSSLIDEKTKSGGEGKPRPSEFETSTWTTQTTTSLVDGEDANWPSQSIMPFRIKAQRQGQKVNVTFELKHSSEVYVKSIYGLELQDKFVDAPEEGNSVATSSVSFSIDSPHCNMKDYWENDEAKITFWPSVDRHITEKYVYGVEAQVDICSFDAVWNDTDRKWERKAETGILTQKLPKPRFRILSDDRDFIIIQSGKDPRIEAELELKYGFELFVMIYIWDWDTKEYIQDVSQISVSEERGKGLYIHSWNTEEAPVGIMKIDVLDETITHSDGSRNEEWKDNAERDRNKIVRARIAVTVMINSKRRSGLLSFRYSWNIHDFETRDIVRRLAAEKVIALRLPYKISQFPSNDVRVYFGRSLCDKDGNKNGQKLGKNCTVECYATGSGLKSVSVIKTHPYIPPLKSLSYVYGRIGQVKLDMGPASDQINGTYRCIAITYNGSLVTEDSQLYTTGFTKVTNFTLEDLGNETARIDCTAYGAPPLNISILVSGGSVSEEENLEETVGTITEVESSGFETRFTMFVSTDELKYPRETITCDASGERGSKRDWLYLSDSNIEEYNPYYPRMIQQHSTIVKGDDDNSKTTIYCAATAGGKPMNMTVAYGGQSKYFSIDRKPGNERKVKDTEYGKLLTLTIPTNSIGRRTSWLYCGAENEFGDDWIEFYLDNYGYK